MFQNTTMRVYGAWVQTYYALFQKHIAALEMCHNQSLAGDKPLEAPVSVKMVYYGVVSTDVRYNLAYTHKHTHICI